MNAKILLVASLLLGTAAPAMAAEGPSLADWRSWLRELPKSGYEVTQGSARLLDATGCRQLVSVFGTCFANNSAAPYIIPEVPEGGAFVDPLYATPFTNSTGNGIGRNIFYRLAADEAVVTVVSLPPEAAYFGYQSYLFSREATKYPAGTPTANRTPNKGRLELFASLGNAVNQATIARRMGESQVQGIWKNATALFITTPNKDLATALAADAVGHGFDEKRIQTEPIGDHAIIGTGPADDDFISLFRYSLPKEHGSNGLNGWQEKVNDNVLVYRIKAKPGTGTTRYKTTPYAARNTKSEAAYRSSLKELVDLLTGWMREHQIGDVIALPTFSSVWLDPADNRPLGLAGIDCAANGRACLGDTQDTDAYRWAKLGKLAPGRLVIMAGVNPTTTGNAGYLSLAAYNQTNLFSAASVSLASGFKDETAPVDLNGSARRLLRHLDLDAKASTTLNADLDKLYAVIFARDCSGHTGFCLALDENALPLGRNLTLTQRAYLPDGATVSANPDVMATPMVLFATTP